jgi:hypothetical protein
LSRIDLIPLSTFDTNIGALSLGITYNAQAIQIDNGTGYQVTLLYGDNQNDQIVSDPTNCVDWRLYQNNNAFNVDPTRKYLSGNGAVPSWP